MTFYGFNAPDGSEKITFNGGCQNAPALNLSSTRIKCDRTWVITIDLPITCSGGQFRFKWVTEPGNDGENWLPDDYREVLVYVLTQGYIAGYIIYGRGEGKIFITVCAGVVIPKKVCIE